MKHESSRKVRLLFITQELNYSSVNLSVAHTWVRELAQRSEALHVIASRVTDVDLPSNVSVHSLGQESDRTRWQRARKLAATVVSLVATRNVNAVMAHMVPAYALAVAPLARTVRIPVVLWYTSHGRSLSLTWANRLVNASVTASVESYPIPSNQAYVLGHGIDTDQFKPRAKQLANNSVVFGMAGRLTPLKGFEFCLQALAALRCDGFPSARMQIAGEPFYPSDHHYLQDLKRLAVTLDIQDVVEFIGPVRGNAMADFYGSLDVFVNWRAQPALDKTGLEAMACGTPVVSNNNAYQSVMGELANDFLIGNTGDDLAIGIKRVFDLSPHARQHASDRMRQAVVKNHSASGLADRLVTVCDSLRQGLRPDFPSVAQGITQT